MQTFLSCSQNASAWVVPGKRRYNDDHADIEPEDDSLLHRQSWSQREYDAAAWLGGGRGGRYLGAGTVDASDNEGIGTGPHPDGCCEQESTAAALGYPPGHGRSHWAQGDVGPYHRPHHLGASN